MPRAQALRAVVNADASARNSSNVQLGSAARRSSAARHPSTGRYARGRDACNHGNDETEVGCVFSQVLNELLFKIPVHNFPPSHARD
jgi:hypothetical protein